MELISFAELSALLQVFLVDLVLAGDNAIVVAMAVAGLPPEHRGRVLAIGIAAAAVLRIAFASVTVQLLQVIGLVFAGGVLLLWVSWKLWRELREQANQDVAAEEMRGIIQGDLTRPVVGPAKTFRAAVMQIVIADVSMSLDNVLAVAGIARGHGWVLVFGLALSVAFMAFAAALIAKVLTRHHWVAYVGLAVILYVALRMIWDGMLQMLQAAT